jgi:peptide/nickel transport system permease protein
MIGFGLVMFWVFTAIFGAMDLIITHDPLDRSRDEERGARHAAAGAEEGEYPTTCWAATTWRATCSAGWSSGAWVVVQIAPLATLFAFMVGITLGLPAGYFGGKLDTFLSFIANLILAFPVILLFYLLVTPEIVATGRAATTWRRCCSSSRSSSSRAAELALLTRSPKRTPLLIVVLGHRLWLYLSLISNGGRADLPRCSGSAGALDLFDIPGGILSSSCRWSS